MEKRILSDIETTEEIAKAIASRGGRAYFAGGFVRDELMGFANKDIDIEVHGIPAEDLKEILEEFGQVITVGKSFGVYSLRGRNIDIAMPRKERNTGAGHRDFEIFTDPFLGIEEAAKRRDFTINSIMKDVISGEIIDSYGGVADLEKGILRHIDPEAFVEDPLRVLRGAQFAARFEFNVAPETVKLCRSTDISQLPKERVEEELRKGLCKGRNPSVFFQILREMDQLDFWFAEVKDLAGVEQDNIFHPEGDVWNHTMDCLDRAAQLRDRTEEPFRFMLAVLVHDLGKVLVTEEIRGRIHAYGHEEAGISLADRFLKRIIGSREVINYVENMVMLHMEPNKMASHRSKIKSTNRMFDRSVCPEELILFSSVDISHEQYEGEKNNNLEFLNERLDIYREYMSRPYVKGRDLIEAGLEPGESFNVILEYAHKLRLAGVDKETAMKQVMGMAGKRVKEKEKQ